MGNRNRTIELSTVPVRAHCPSGGRRYNTIWLRVYDPIFVVFGRTCPLYEKVAFKSTSAEPLPRRAIGTGQLSRLRFRAGPIARRGGGRHNAIFYLRCVRQGMGVIETPKREAKDYE